MRGIAMPIKTTTKTATIMMATHRLLLDIPYESPLPPTHPPLINTSLQLFLHTTGPWEVRRRGRHAGGEGPRKRRRSRVIAHYSSSAKLTLLVMGLAVRRDG
eukprot:scaffold1373_cov288-Alexandrium_tamarense.AAC.6